MSIDNLKRKLLLSSNAIEVVLGAEENTAVIVRYLSGQEIGRANRTGVLSCEKWHQFWFVKTDYNLEIGLGSNSTETLLQVAFDTPLPLNSMSLGSTSEAYWLHGHVSGMFGE